MAQDLTFTSATPADIAADMAAHRKSYKAFLNVVKFTCVAVAIVLVAIFLAYPK